MRQQHWLYVYGKSNNQTIGHTLINICPLNMPDFSKIKIYEIWSEKMRKMLKKKKRPTSHCSRLLEVIVISISLSGFALNLTFHGIGWAPLSWSSGQGKALLHLFFCKYRCALLVKHMTSGSAYKLKEVQDGCSDNQGGGGRRWGWGGGCWCFSWSIRRLLFYFVLAL